MLRRWGVLVAAALLLSGCGAAGEANPEKIGPRGVDELVIPTPSPDPDDFVTGVDNPWLPLAPGTVWTYDVSGSPATRLVVTVAPSPVTVGGVPCVVVHSVATDAAGGTVSEQDAYYAQDRRGNVWLFGQQSAGGSWRAGSGGAEAGLAMAARPRVGDGYLEESAPGVAEDRTTVLALDAESTVPAGTFGDVLVVETRAGEGDPRTTRRWYAEGAGLVESYVSLGGTEHAELVSVTGIS
jgi:hypothetical protein